MLCATTVEPSEQQQDPSSTTQISDIIQAVTKGLESALRNVLVRGQFPPDLKRSPHRRRTENREVQEEMAAELSTERDYFLVSPCAVYC